ncbi:MAG: radical SAM protein [Candidatus Omnitrophica bacterium]|nr:radical SAM protein [Candidatus Omnitrophota bacterium]
MCYAIPGKIKEIDGKTVVVDYFGQEKRAINEFYDLGVGDYVSAQGGFVIKKVSPAEAEETLLAWKELFFELQDMDLRLSGINLNQKNIDKGLRLILDKALENIPLVKKDLLYLLSLDRQQDKELFFKAANFLRQKYHQNACCVHGIIEISNFCNQSCQYCGIAASNRNLSRYRMSVTEVVEAAVEAVEKYGFQALILQSGEDSDYKLDDLVGIIEQVKNRCPVLIGVSFGEVGLDGLDRLYKAGARALLMRFESSNPEIFAKVHPGRTLDSRLAHIRKARDLGFIIMTGSLIGLPGQTREDIVNDIYLTKALGAEMYSFGPFLPHPDTPLAGCLPSNQEEVLKTLALIRFIDPETAKILVTTAFETLSSQARRLGLLSGANSVMLNVTPLKYRRHYAIYPDKADIYSEINDQIRETIDLLKSLGRAPTDLGISSDLVNNHEEK